MAKNFDDVEEAIGWTIEKIRAQVPVTASELHALWMDGVEFYNTVFAAFPPAPPTEEMKKSGLEAFKLPETYPPVIRYEQRWKLVQKQLEENQGRIDTVILDNIAKLTPNDELTGPRKVEKDITPEMQCHENLLIASREIRVVWHKFLDDFLKPTLIRTIVARALIPEARHLVPNFQALLDYVQAHLQLSNRLLDFAHTHFPLS